MMSLGSDGVRAYGRAQPDELIAWVLALDERDQLEAKDRVRLDRELRARLPQTERDGAGLLRAWLREAPSEALQARIARARTSLSLLRWLLIGGGAFLGWAAAATLLQFEVHAGRINIVLCLGMLVVLPLLMLLMACIGAGWSRRSASSDRLQGSGLTGGWRSLALSRLAMSLLSGSVRRDVELVLGRLSMHAGLYGGVRRAQLFVWSQWIGFAFAAGALVATLAFVIFTDLAFGWSTTLDVEAESVHRLVRAMSSPWAVLWPAASPPFDLVESTRHFRVGGAEHTHLVDPILYGGWWPFLVASILAYGFLPRILAVFLGSRWLGREVGEAIVRTPGLEFLASQLTTPHVESQATGPEGEIGRALHGLIPLVPARDWIREQGGEAPLVIRWAEASEDEGLMAMLAATHLLVRDAGGRRSLAEDEALVRVAGQGSGGVALCVRAYEPPVLDVLDFLADLRRAIGPSRGLCVLLVEGSASDHAAWRNKLVGLADPGLRVALLDADTDVETPPDTAPSASANAGSTLAGGSRTREAGDD